MTDVDPMEVELEGEIDVQRSDAVRAELRHAVDTAGGRTVIVDLTRVTFLDSSGLSALIAGKRTADAQGTPFQVRGASDNLRRLFEVTGLLGHFGLDEDNATAP